MKYKLMDYVAINQSGMLFNTRTGDSFAVNATGHLVLESLMRNLDMKETEESIFREYQVERDILHEHISDFVHFLVKNGLAEEITDLTNDSVC